MEHQYPGPISGDENMLAELMLPDQAHVRHQDWTIFFLHKEGNENPETENTANEESEEDKKKTKAEGEVADTDEETDAAESTDEEGRKVPDVIEEQDVEGGEGPPLIYVLNLVNTKQDTLAKRFCALFDPHFRTLDLTSRPVGVRLSKRWQSVHGILFSTFIRWADPALRPSTADCFIASFIACTGRIFQVACPQHASVIIRCRKFDGFILDAPAFGPRASYSTGQ